MQSKLNYGDISENKIYKFYSVKIMGIIFMGTPEWAIPSLQAVLDSGSEISAVFTQSDRRVGRKRVLTTSSIKQFAQNQNLSVHSLEKAGGPEKLELVRS